MLPDDISKFIEDNFASRERSEALALLANARLHNGLSADVRMLRCALVASKNSLVSLKLQIDGLAHDYRDVILAGEYVRKKGEWVQVRDLSKPFLHNA
ncbi:hypothetical protein FACS1894158_05110 [Betaproteobacteria bacterium]|nr:hypothetical protein FACS1894158_05110 [Betaproteobacteria bacterium]